jgi:RNA polymerase sigma factor (TIGR02999 family)
MPSSPDSSPASSDLTTLFVRYAAGDRQAVDQLTPQIYEELRRVARNHFRNERADHTLQSTALVNEAFLRLSEQRDVHWENRAHFFRLASQVMRHVLVDHARAKNAEKRGGDMAFTSLDQTVANFHEHCARHLYLDGSTQSDSAAVEMDFLALEDALGRLRELSPRQAQVIDLRFFGGLSIEETAAVMDISSATVKREWTMARLFLKRELETATR